MEINYDIFRAFIDQSHPDEMIEASSILQENFINPQLALFILSVYQEKEVKDDRNLIHAMVLILFRIIEHIWSDSKRLEEYSQEVISQIKDQIIPIYLNTPRDFQSNIIEALSVIIKYENFHSEELIVSASNLINPQQDLHIVSFVFQVLEKYSDAIKISKDGVNRGEPFCDTFLQIWLTILPQLQESFTNSPTVDSYQIVKSCSAAMTHLLLCAEDSLLKQETIDLAQFFITILSFPSEEAECNRMKESILNFFKGSLLTDNKRQQYTENIRQLFIENFMELVSQIFPSILESKTIGALSALMNIFFVFIFKKDFSQKDWFYSTEFVFNYLIPAARLTKSDLDEFESSPAHYIGYAISSIDEADESIKEFNQIPRFVCAQIIRTMISRKPELFNCELSQFTNPFDLEAYLYLIYQGYNLRENIDFALSDEAYSQILGLLNTQDLPEYIYPSALCALHNNIILSNYELLKTVSSSSYEIVMNPQMNLIFVVPALSLFRITIKSLSEKGDLDSLINLKDLITRLVNISTEINTKETQIVMKNLIECCGPQIRELSRELFEPYSQFILEISQLKNAEDISPQQDDEINTISDTLFLLFNIQDDKNERQYFAEKIISLTVNILQEYPNSIGVESLINLCFDVCEKIDLESISEEFKSFLAKFVHFVVTYLSSSMSEESFELYLFPNFASVIAVLMPIIDSELLQNIQIICFTILQDQENNMEDILYAALLVLSDIILVHGANINEITQFAMEIIKQSQQVSYVLISSIFVLTSALFKTKGSFAQFIPEEILQKWIETSNIEDLQKQREIHNYVLGLLILSENGNELAFKAAGDLLLQNFQIFEEEEDEFYDDFDEKSFDFEKIALSIDKENVSKRYLELVKKFGPPEGYSEEFHAWLNQRAYGQK